MKFMRATPDKRHGIMVWNGAGRVNQMLKTRALPSLKDVESPGADSADAVVLYGNSVSSEDCFAVKDDIAPGENRSQLVEVPSFGS